MIAISNRLQTTLLVLVPVIATASILLRLPTDSRYEPLDERILYAVRGADDSFRVNQPDRCEDHNEDLSIPQWSPSRCIDGHECVSCDYPPIVGLTIGGNGDRVWQARSLQCYSSNRKIGVCVWNTISQSSVCDLSNTYLDGECGGSVIEWHPQPQGGYPY